MKQKPSLSPTLVEWCRQLPAERAGALLAALEGVHLAAGESLPAIVESELIDSLTILEELRADPETFVACLLHEYEQAGVVFPESMQKGWSAGLRLLMEGQRAAQRVWSLYSERRATGGAEGLRRLLLAIIRDLRVVFILLARQVARMRAAGRLPVEQQRALAYLSADIHAPLANRLGIWQLKWELEDLAFRYSQPEVYKRIAQLLDERRADRETYIQDAIALLGHALEKAGIKAELAGRPKHIYSIWRKMSRKGIEFSELYDIRAIRVLVENIPSCYAALGVAHSLWPHVPGEFDDYITRPKGNHYQSLHTAVIGPQGKTLEVQIRSHDMHEHAELGVAAHWRYKEGGGGDQSFERKIAWMRQLLETKDESNDDAALLAGFKTEILEDRVYLLTPQGQVMDLPRGATVLDFAYHVHTDVGHRCHGAKVNNRIVPLTFTPVSGDCVEILTGKVLEPRRDWLNPHRGFLTTHRALEKVRAWFRRCDHAENVAAGRTLLEKELRRLALSNIDLDTLAPKFQLKTLDELLVALALGDIGSSQMARVLHETQTPVRIEPPQPTRVRKLAKDALTIEGVGNLLTTLARCCQPLPGDPVLGFITRGRGVSVHRADCSSLARLRARDATRLIEIEWGAGQAQAYEVSVLVRAYDRKWLHKDITNVIAANNVHLLAVNTQTDRDQGIVLMNYAIRVTDFGQLSTLLNRLAGVPNVLEARRVV